MSLNGNIRTKKMKHDQITFIQTKTLYLTSIFADIVLKSKQNIVFDFNSCRYCSEIK